MANRRIKCKLFDLSGHLLEYQSVWRLQKALMEDSNRLFKSRQQAAPATDTDDGIMDCLILVQHKSVYTLGRGATKDNLKFKPDSNCPHEVVRVERGGEVTWHGPGQLVAYPIFNLNNHKRDLHWFTEQLEQTAINTIESYGIQGERSEVNTGVWVGKNKVSAVGVTASRWVTMHGISLNVHCDLASFAEIIPCGIDLPDRGVCSIQSILLDSNDNNDSIGSNDSNDSSSGGCSAGSESGRAIEIPSIEQVSAKWTAAFADVFGLEVVHPSFLDQKCSIHKEYSEAVFQSLVKLVEDKHPEVAQLTLPQFRSEQQE